MTVVKKETIYPLMIAYFNLGVSLEMMHGLQDTTVQIYQKGLELGTAYLPPSDEILQKFMQRKNKYDMLMRP